MADAAFAGPVVEAHDPAAGWVGTAVGVVFAAVVAGPWVGRGQVLLLDWVSGQHAAPLGGLLGADGGTLGGSVFLLLIRGLRMVVGPSASTWIPLVAWMPIVGWGVGRLTARAGWPAAASAASLAVCNPFTLDRLAVGQVNVLWGYALLPLAVLTVRAEPGNLRSWSARVALVGAALTAITPHFFAYWLAVVLVAVAVLPAVRRRALGALLATGGALVASCYLFVVPSPSFTIGAADLSAYRTRAESPGLAVTILSLRGFWRFSGVASSRSAIGWLLLALLGAVVVLGVVAMRNHREVAFIGVAGLVGAVMAAGDQGPSGRLYRFAFEEVGPFRILREPQKASALLALALSAFFGFGVSRLLSLTGAGWPRMAGAAVLMAAPLATAPTLPAFGTRVDAVRPSAAWREADRIVGTGPAGVLALPWHQYLRYRDLPSPVANLASTRFRAPVASGDNVELPGLPTTSNRQRSRYLEELLFRRGPEMTDFGTRIEPAGLGWVLLVKTVDWTSYSWVEQQRDLVRVLDTPELALYRSSAPTALGADSASRRRLGSWRVGSTGDQRVPLPEVAEGRWVAADGRVEITEAGAPGVISAGTTVRSSNVRKAIVGLAFSAAATALLAILALRHRAPSRRRWRRPLVALRSRPRSSPEQIPLGSLRDP